MSFKGNTKPIDAEYLRTRLSYDHVTGILTWKKKGAQERRRGKNTADWNKRFAGQQAGAVSRTGYRELSIGSKTLKAHRVAWAIYTGCGDFGAIDHIDGNRDNNAIKNLRLADPCENARNRALSSNNKSGVMGVIKSPNGKYRASIGQMHIGSFASMKEALAARYGALKALKYHENHGRKPHVAVQLGEVDF